MTVFTVNGRNERLGKLFKTPKHLLLKDGMTALERSVNYMTDLGPYIVICGAHYDEGLSGFNRVVIPPTENVIDTIQRGIKGSYQQPLYVVDCDVIPVKLWKPKGNTVYLFENEQKHAHYSNFEVRDGKVLSCNEKGEVMKYAGAGIYYFESIGTFFKYANYCKSVSEVFQKMLTNNVNVFADTTSEIFRFGTLQDINGI